MAPETARLGEGSPMTRVMASGQESAVVQGRSTVDGLERIAAFRRVGPDWPVYVSVARNRSAVVSGWRRTMAPQAMLALASSLLLLLLSRTVIRRERELAAANATLERRVAERTRALANSEARLRRAQDAAGAVAFEIGPAGLVTDAPAAFRALYGLSPDAVVDYATVLSRVHPGDRDHFEADHRRLALAGGPFRNEFRVVLPDGSVRWLLASGEAEPAPAAPGCRDAWWA
jgi:PAS domain S-box-containing protein